MKESCWIVWTNYIYLAFFVELTGCADIKLTDTTINDQDYLSLYTLKMFWNKHFG